MLSVLTWLLSFLGKAIFMVSYVTPSAAFLKPLSPEEEAHYIEEHQRGSKDAKISLLNIISEKNYVKLINYYNQCVSNI